MKRKRFTKEQIIRILKESESAGNIRDLCRLHNITEQTWRKNRVGPPKLTDINNKTSQTTPVEYRYTRYLVSLLVFKLITPIRGALLVQITWNSISLTGIPPLWLALSSYEEALRHGNLQREAIWSDSLAMAMSLSWNTCMGSWRSGILMQVFTPKTISFTCMNRPSLTINF